MHSEYTYCYGNNYDDINQGRRSCPNIYLTDTEKNIRIEKFYGTQINKIQYILE